MSEAEVARWKAILDVRACVNRALESARSKKLFGSSLEAELELRIGSPALRQLLDDFQTRTNAVAPFDALEELFIVSSVRITDATAGSSDDVVESTVTLADGIVPLQFLTTPVISVRTQLIISIRHTMLARRDRHSVRARQVQSLSRAQTADQRRFVPALRRCGRSVCGVVMSCRIHIFQLPCTLAVF
jgi:isoleucyl-tRNA synthetase